MATPLAFDQLAFVLQVSRVEEAGTDGPNEAAGSCSSRAEEEHDGSSVQIPQYLAHQLPRKWKENQEGERCENGNGTDLETEHTQNLSATEPKAEPQHTQVRAASEPESGHTQIQSATEPEPEHTQIQTESATDLDPSTGGAVICETVFSQVERDVLDTTGPVCLPTPSSLVLSALNRAKQTHLRQRVDPLTYEVAQTHARGRGSTLPQRSFSLPSSLLSPSRVVSSVRIQFGQGQASCTPPAYSYKYSQQEGWDQDQQEEEGQTNCLSTLIINPTSSINQHVRLPTEAPSTPPKPIPRYLLRSMYSLQSPSSPPDCSPAGHTHSWSTQSVPDLSSNQQNPGLFHQNTSTNQNQIWNSGPTLFPSSSPNPIPSLNSITIPNHSPNPFAPNPPPQYPSPLHLYSSLPNLCHPPFPHYSSHSSLHHPTTPTIPLHQAPASLAPPHAGLSNLHHHHHHHPPGAPIMHHPGYKPSPYPGTPPGSPFDSPYFGYHGYTAPHLGYANTATQCPPLAPENVLYPGPSTSAPAPGSFLGLVPAPGVGQVLHPGLAVPAPSASGFFPLMALAPAPGFHPDLSAAPGLGHNPVGPGSLQGPSGTEMQLRRVLHDIRGTVQSLNQVCLFSSLPVVSSLSPPSSSCCDITLFFMSF